MKSAFLFGSQRILRLAASAAGAALLSGCLPYATTYVHLSGEGIAHRRELCRLGPEVAAVYARGGVELEVSLAPGWSRPKADRMAYLTISAPVSTVIDIPKRDFAFTLNEAASKSLPAQIEGRFDASGRAEPSQRLGGKAIYRFRISAVPAASAFGNFKLPAIYANGLLFDPPQLSFQPRVHAGVLPLNC